jgi:hypothetical protein
MSCINRRRYRFFDIDTPAMEIGYEPIHDSEEWMTIFGDAGKAGARGEYG